MQRMPTQVDPAGVEPRAILEAADLRNTRVLEVGAGDGRLTFQYASESNSVVGIDTKQGDILSTAKLPKTDSSRHVHLMCACATALPFSAEEFNVVLLASSL